MIVSNRSDISARGLFCPSFSCFHAYAALRDRHGPLFGEIFTQWNSNGCDKGITVQCEVSPVVEEN